MSAKDLSLRPLTAEQMAPHVVIAAAPTPDYNSFSSLLNENGFKTEVLDDFQQVLADGLVQLQNASEQVVYTQASLGGRMNAVESVSDSNFAQDIQNKSNLSDLVEVDMAEAISELTKQETALQASQATFGRLTNLSLFDYL